MILQIQLFHFFNGYKIYLFSKISLTFSKELGSPIFPGKVTKGIQVLFSVIFTLNNETPVITCPSRYADSMLKPSLKIVLEVIPPLETKYPISCFNSLTIWAMNNARSFLNENSSHFSLKEITFLDVNKTGVNSSLIRSLIWSTNLFLKSLIDEFLSLNFKKLKNLSKFI